MPDQPVATLPDYRSREQVRRARNLRRVGLGALYVVLLLGLASVLGVRTGHVSATQAGYRLTVDYPQVTRAGLAVPLHIRLDAPAPITEPVTLEVSRGLWERFDFQNYYPNPSAETADADVVSLEFDPPDAPVFTMSLDARTAPDQNGGTGRYRIAALDGSTVLAAVDFRLWVVP